MLFIARVLQATAQTAWKPRWTQAAEGLYIARTWSSTSVIDSTISGDVFYREGDWNKLRKLSDEKLHEVLTSPARFQSIDSREDRTDVPNNTVGKYLSQYRQGGAYLLKNPTDLSVYYQLFFHVRPKVVFELGTYSGASAIWYDDTAKSLDLDCHIYSVDIEPALLHEEWKLRKPDTVDFIIGDTTKPKDIFPPSMLEPLPHPWLIVEDSHDNAEAVVEYFHQFMQVGDYLVIEDTSPYVCPGDTSPKWGVQKLNLLRDLLRSPIGQNFKVDSFFTDLYGYNCTWHWHGFLRKCS